MDSKTNLTPELKEIYDRVMSTAERNARTPENEKEAQANAQEGSQDNSAKLNQTLPPEENSTNQVPLESGTQKMVGEKTTEPINQNLAAQNEVANVKAEINQESQSISNEATFERAGEESASQGFAQPPMQTTANNDKSSNLMGNGMQDSSQQIPNPTQNQVPQQNPKNKIFIVLVSIVFILILIAVIAIITGIIKF